jgi:beta-1,2-mannobiose phosphorylase / 1,2-beta-oligomannan phosphorylase
MEEQNFYPHDLGVIAKEKEVLLFSNIFLKNIHPFHAAVSNDGLRFRRFNKNPVITNSAGDIEDTSVCKNFRISHDGSQYVLIYKKFTQETVQSCIAVSKDAINWKTIDTDPLFAETAMMVPNFTFKKQRVIYYGDVEIRAAYTEDFQSWNTSEKSILAPRNTHFDNHPLEVCSTFNTKDGNVILYAVRTRMRDGNQYQLGLALMDKRNPARVLWRSEMPLWSQGDKWQGEHAYPMGAVQFKDKMIVYFGVEKDGVHALMFPNVNELISGKNPDLGPQLEKASHNPIITPVLKHHWEASAVFNTAAVYEGGKVHFVYRAMGPANTSVLGYATSSDGEHVDDRADEPIYGPTEWFEVPGRYPSINYMSGGGYGGCEDPRITKVDDTFFMTYVAYNGIDAPRVALTSIKVDDFLNKRWDMWSKPRLISKPGVVNKNCVIFPEKVQGKYVIIHRVFPNILLDFVDDLTFEDTFLDTKGAIGPRNDNWDSRKLGAGAPPIKTKEGWLLIYQAVDDRDPGKYKIGAMLLDLDDPTKVLFRCNNPILEPTHWYENEGFKSGVAYPCGAVVMEGRLMVYYGGADTVICVASSPLDEFLEKLKKSSKVKKKPIAEEYKLHYKYY